MRNSDEVQEALDAVEGLVMSMKTWQDEGLTPEEIEFKLLLVAVETGSERLSSQFLLGMHRAFWWVMGGHTEDDRGFLEENGIDPATGPRI